jgi:hypothetical protein
LFELNEAFSVVVRAAEKIMNIDPAIINVRLPVVIRIGRQLQELTCFFNRHFRSTVVLSLSDTYVIEVLPSQVLFR